MAAPGVLRPLAPCTAPGCPNLVRGGGRCPEHLRPAWLTTTTSRHERGYGSTWVRLRGRALRRDHRRCVMCGSGPTDDNPLEVDHIVPLALGGANALYNLRTLCSDCHGAVTARARQAAARGER